MADNIIGTDGRYPIEDSEPLWRIWSLAQIWDGGVRLGGDARESVQFVQAHGPSRKKWGKRDLK